MSYLGFCPTGVVLPYAGSTAPDGWLLCNGQAYATTLYPALSAVLGTTYNTQIDPTTGAAWAAPAAGQFRVPDYRGSFLRGVGTASGADATTLGGHQVQKTARNGLTVSPAASSVSVSGTKDQLNNSVSVSGAQNQFDFTTGNNSVSHTHSGSGSTANAGDRDSNNHAYVRLATGLFYGITQSSNTGQAGIAESGVHQHSFSVTTGGVSANHTHSKGYGTSTFSASGSFSYSGSFSASGTAAAQSVSYSADNETRPVNKGVQYIIKI